MQINTQGQATEEQQIGQTSPKENQASFENNNFCQSPESPQVRTDSLDQEQNQENQGLLNDNHVNGDQILNKEDQNGEKNAKCNGNMNEQQDEKFQTQQNSNHDESDKKIDTRSDQAKGTLSLDTKIKDLYPDILKICPSQDKEESEGDFECQKPLQQNSEELSQKGAPLMGQKLACSSYNDQPQEQSQDDRAVCSSESYFANFQAAQEITRQLVPDVTPSSEANKAYVVKQNDEIIQELAAQVIVSEISQKSDAVQQLVHTIPVLAESLSQIPEEQSQEDCEMLEYQQMSQQKQDTSNVLGKRQRRNTARNEDVAEESHLGIEDGSNAKNKRVKSQTKEAPQRGHYGPSDSHFFQQKVANDLIGPLFHLDKLQVLRKEHVSYEILICPSKDLKGLSKERKQELLSVITEEDTKIEAEIQEATSLRESSSAVEDLSQSQIQQKRKKRSNYLSNSYVKRSQNAAEISWIDNTTSNLILKEERKQKIQEAKRQKDQNRRNNQKLQNQENINIGEEQIKGESDQSQNDDVEMKSVESKGNESCQDQAEGFLSRTSINSAEDIYQRFSNGYYHSCDSLVEDVESLVFKVSESRCKNNLAVNYLKYLLQGITHHIRKKQTEFNDRWHDYYKAKFNENSMRFVHMQDQSWQNDKLPTTVAKRQYHMVDDYKPAVSQQKAGLNAATGQIQSHGHRSTQEEQIREKMITTKALKCSGECCTALEPDKEVPDHEESNCLCTSKKSECSPQCGCDPNVCNNRQMSLKQSLVLSEDVQERISWGIDIFTAVNLISVLPNSLSNQQKSDFIENKLIFAVQQQRERGYDIRLALNCIIQPQKFEDPAIRTRFNEVDKELARVILDAVQMTICVRQLNGELKESRNDLNFRVHSKGLGIFCKKSSGIRKESLIVEYFGEIYSPWYWYEKQDVLKQGQNKSQLSKELPEFYNIIYERHFDDPAGYDILTVDPVLHGNYASRLSHSCNPNCQTIIKVKNQTSQKNSLQTERIYSIGMFASKQIKYGEELCFNYCSMTESEKEFEAAACLCGTVKCDGRFLQLASDKKFMTVMKKYHTFVDRNYILFEAISQTMNDDEITKQDILVLDQCGLRSSLLQTLPKWLIKWAALICEYIEFEHEKYPQIVAEIEQAQHDQLPLSQQNDNEKFYFSTMENLQLDAKAIRESKIQNVAITLNKVHHVLTEMGSSLPPIRELTPKEVYDKLWGNKESLRQSLEYILQQLEKPCAEADLAQECIELVDPNESWDRSFQDQGQEDQFFQELLWKSRQALMFISQHLRIVKSRIIAIPALCDNLYFYSMTETYFTSTDYSRIKGNEVCIRNCDIHSENKPTPPKSNEDGAEENDATVKNTDDLGKTVYRGFKEYDASYIWGQLIGWYKQTVDKPNASLSADRRGTLSMPDLESFIITSKNQSGSSGVKKHKKNTKVESEEEVMPSKLKGSRSRPRQNAPETVASQAIDKGKNGEVHEDIKVPYPSKKNPTRQGFMDGWMDNFSKQYDTCCHWSFKNKMKAFGSIQFESIKKSGNQREARLDFYQEVLNHLKTWP